MTRINIFRRKHRPAAAIVAIAAAALALGACDDPTVVDDHLDVEGFTLSFTESDLPSYTFMLDDLEPETLTLPAGSHAVVFVPLAHDGQVIAEEEGHEEEEPGLLVTISDNSVLTWLHDEGVENAAHPFVEFYGTLVAEGGTTLMEVCFLHEAHCDFRVSIPVTVTAQ